MSRDNHPFSILSIFFFGTILGSIAALLLSTDEKGEMKGKVKTKIKYAKNRISAGEDWLTDLANDAAAEVASAFNQAKTKVQDRVELMRDKLGNVDKSKYTKAVAEVVTAMKDIGEVTAEQAKTITKYLLDDYQTLAAKPKQSTRKK
jgi:methyl-accepting chemotaxis protein